MGRVCFGQGADGVVRAIGAKITRRQEPKWLTDPGVRFDGLSAIEIERWRAFAKDAGGDTALIGTLFWIAAECGWRADWRLVWQGDHRWQIRGVSFDAAFRNAMEGSAQIISGQGEPT